MSKGLIIALSTLGATAVATVLGIVGFKHVKAHEVVEAVEAVAEEIE
jgi:hypothetical protein